MHNKYQKCQLTCSITRTNKVIDVSPRNRGGGKNVIKYRTILLRRSCRWSEGKFVGAAVRENFHSLTSSTAAEYLRLERERHTHPAVDQYRKIPQRQRDAMLNLGRYNVAEIAEQCARASADQCLETLGPSTMVF